MAYNAWNDSKHRMAGLCMSTVYRYIHATLQPGKNWNIHILYAASQVNYCHCVHLIMETLAKHFV